MVSNVGNYNCAFHAAPQKKSSKSGAITGAIAGTALGTAAVANAYVSGATKGSFVTADSNGRKISFSYAPSIKGFMKYCKDFVNDPLSVQWTSTKGSLVDNLVRLIPSGRGKLAKAGRVGLLAGAITLPIAMCKFIGEALGKWVSKD